VSPRRDWAGGHRHEQCSARDRRYLGALPQCRRGGAIQSLLSTNQLARVRDPELRQALAAWPGKVAALVRLEDGLHAMQQTRLMPLIQRVVPQINIERTNGFTGVPELRDEFRSLVDLSRFGNDLIPLLRDLEFENVGMNRMTVSMIARDATMDLAEEGERILALVESGLRQGARRTRERDDRLHHPADAHRSVPAHHDRPGPVRRSAVRGNASLRKDGRPTRARILRRPHSPEVIDSPVADTRRCTTKRHERSKSRPPVTKPKAHP
jgi:hypothetical protein